MDRTIKLTITITNVDSTAPDGEDIKLQMEEDFTECLSENSKATVILETEYDE